MERIYQKRSLKQDTSGAIMIMGLFMAVFLVGLLYYILGIAEAVVHREAMQDASDAVSFAGAAMNARGMNLIVLLNIIMAVAVAVLLGLRMLQLMAVIATLVATGICFIPLAGSWACPFIGFFTNVSTTLQNIISRVEPVVKKITVVADKAQDAIALAWPLLSQARAVDMSRASANRPPATFGFVWPVYGRLPVEDDALRETCDRGGEMIKDMVTRPFEALGRIGDAIGGAIGSVVSTALLPLKAYYCGARAGEAVEAPSFSVETQVGYPQSDVQQACANACIDPATEEVMSYSTCSPCRSSRDSPGCRDARAQACEEYEASLRVVGVHECEAPCDDTSPVTPRGSCADKGNRVGHTASDGPGSMGFSPLLSGSEMSQCISNANQAANLCRKDSHRGRDNLTWVEENRYRVFYRVDGADGCIIEHFDAQRNDLHSGAIDAQVRADDDIDLCWGPFRSSLWGSTSTPWPAACRPQVDEGHFCPGSSDPLACQTRCLGMPTQAEALDQVRAARSPGALNSIADRVRIVYEISGCSETSEEEVPLELGDSPGNGRCGDSSEWGCPKQVCRYRNGGLIATSCPTSDREGTLYLGDDDFQLRGIVFGESPSTHGHDGVAVAAHETATEGEPVGALGHFFGVARHLSRVSVAQSEFFWNQDEGWEDGLNRGRTEWMWDMSWMARMRRVSFGDATSSDLGDACGSAPGGGACDGGGLGAILGNIFSH